MGSRASCDPSAPGGLYVRCSWCVFRCLLLSDVCSSSCLLLAGPETESRKLVSDEFNALFDSAVARLKSIGGKLFDEMDYTVFEEAGRLLYEGSFVAERVSGVKEWYDQHPAAEEDALLPEIRSIYDAAATSFTAADAWEDLRKQMASQRLAAKQFAGGFQVRFRFSRRRRTCADGVWRRFSSFRLYLSILRRRSTSQIPSSSTTSSARCVPRQRTLAAAFC